MGGSSLVSLIDLNMRIRRAFGMILASLLHVSVSMLT